MEGAGPTPWPQSAPSVAAQTWTETLPGRGGPQRQGLPDSQDGFRPPTFFEASQFSKIPEATIKSWWKKGDQLLTIVGFLSLRPQTRRYYLAVGLSHSTPY